MKKDNEMKLPTYMDLSKKILSGENTDLVITDIVVVPRETIDPNELEPMWFANESTDRQNNYKILIDIMKVLELTTKMITLDTIIEASKKYKLEILEIKKLLQRMKEEGIIFEPRREKYKFI